MTQPLIIPICIYRWKFKELNFNCFLCLAVQKISKRRLIYVSFLSSRKVCKKFCSFRIAFLMLSMILAKLMHQYVTMSILWKISILTSSSSNFNDSFRLFFLDKIVPNFSRLFVRPLLSNATELLAGWQHLLGMFLKPIFIFSWSTNVFCNFLPNICNFGSAFPDDAAYNLVGDSHLLGLRQGSTIFVNSLKKFNCI